MEGSLMDPGKILHEYSSELQLIDMLDWLQGTKDSWGSPIPPALDSSIERNDEQLLD
jgi:hypothetical protein